MRTFSRSEPVVSHRTRTHLVVAGLILVAAARTLLVLNLPLEFLHTANHDDGLYMRLAAHLAAGEWLGPYSQFTLMKGPGYPVFLAVTALSGLPVSATHALLQVAAIAVAAWAVLRITRSGTLAAVTFLILALHPLSFTPSLQGVIRDQIYWAQTLVVFALFTVVLFAPPRSRLQAACLSAITGLCFAWTWLTREEGIWFLPGLALLVVGAAIANRKRKDMLAATAVNLGVAALLFVALNAAFMTMNRATYGMFVGVDFKERNFTAALNGLEDVATGPIIPYLSVPAATRDAVAKVSPTFAPLNAAIAPGGPLSGKFAIGCQVYEHTCGDFATGWFMWLLRDAAAQNGFYRSPALAAAKFGQIADDIAAACADGRLTCRSRWLNYLPPTSAAQWRTLPGALANVAAQVFLLNTPDMQPTAPSQVAKRPDDFKRYWTLLNRPYISGPQTAAPTPASTIRAALVMLYHWLLPLLTLAGLAAFGVASIRGISRRTADPAFVVALAAWTLIATRITLLALIEVSSFPVLSHLYAMPASYLAVIASAFSLAALDIDRPRRTSS